MPLLTGRRRAFGAIVSLWLLFLFQVAFELAPAGLWTSTTASQFGPFDLGAVVDGLGPGVEQLLAALDRNPAGGKEAIEAVRQLVTTSVFLGMAVGVLVFWKATEVLDAAIFWREAGYIEVRRVTAVSTVAFLLATVWARSAAVHSHYWSFVAARFVAGAAVALTLTVAVPYVSGDSDNDDDVLPDWLDAGFLPADIGPALFLTVVPFGFFVGLLSQPLLETTNLAFVVWDLTANMYADGLPAFGVISTAFLGLFWVLGEDQDLGERSGFRAALSNGAVLGVCVLGFATFSVNVFFLTWLPGQSGLDLALVFALLGVVARVVAEVAYRWPPAERQGAAAMRAILASLVALLLLTVVFAVVAESGLPGNTALPAMLLVVVALVVNFGLVLLYSYLPGRLEGTDVNGGTAIAVLNSAGFVGAFAFPVVAASLAWNVRFALVGSTCAVGVLVAAGLARGGVTSSIAVDSPQG